MLEFTEWDTEDDEETWETGEANWRCFSDEWTLDVWRDGGVWSWDVTWGGDYVGEQSPYEMGSAYTEGDAMEGAQAACIEMDILRRASETVA